MVFEKGRAEQDVLFIDASREYEEGTNQNRLRVEDLEKITQTYQDFATIDKYSYVANRAELEENDFNLNIPRYVDTFEEEELVDIPAVQEEIKNLEGELQELRGKMEDYLKELGFN
jgi:type I restriction enzyme M protein